MHKKNKYGIILILVSFFVLTFSCKTLDMEPKNEVVKDKIEEMEKKSEDGGI